MWKEIVFSNKVATFFTRIFLFLPDNENESGLKPVKKIDRVSCLIFKHTMIFPLNCKLMN